MKKAYLPISKRGNDHDLWIAVTPSASKPTEINFKE